MTHNASLQFWYVLELLCSYGASTANLSLIIYKQTSLFFYEFEASYTINSKHCYCASILLVSVTAQPARPGLISYEGFDLS
jgi:hypothetical protein